MLKGLFRRREKPQDVSREITLLDMECPACYADLFISTTDGLKPTHNDIVMNFTYSRFRLTLWIDYLERRHESLLKAIEKTNYHPAILSMQTLSIKTLRELAALELEVNKLLDEIKRQCSRKKPAATPK